MMLGSGRLISAWRSLLRPAAWRRLPPDVYRALATQLFGISLSITLTEALLVALIGGLAAWRVQDSVLATLGAGTVLLVILLPVHAWNFRRRGLADGAADEIRSAERWFCANIWAASAGIGLITAWSLLAFDDPLLHLTLVALALGATVTSLRDHYRPPVAFWKTVAILLPTSLAAILTGQLYYQLLGVGGLVTGKLILDIILELYGSSHSLRIALDEKDQLSLELRSQAAELKRLQSELIETSRMSAMGAMGSVLAHELNQPLTAVANYARASRRLLLDPTPDQLDLIREGVAAAEEGALRAGEIVRSIRSLVEGQGGRRRPEDLAQIVREGCDFACLDDRAAQVELQLEVVAGQMLVSADSVQLQQVVVNLVRNAFDALAGVPRARLVVSARAVNDMAEVAVSDNGPGLAEREPGDMFTPFRSTKGSMGIGLSISRAIVESHGGRIWSASASGGGAEFRFTVPLHEGFCAAAGTVPGAAASRSLAATH